jgi:hypothetical protein
LVLRLRDQVLAWSDSSRQKNDPLPVYRLLPALVTKRICPPLARPCFGHVVGRQHLDFLDRVHVLDADDRARRRVRIADGAVHGDGVLLARCH